VHTANRNLPPLLEIRVELVAPDVLFSPDLTTNVKGDSVTSVLKVMLDAVTLVPSLLKKLDIAGDFGDDVLSDASLQMQVKNYWNLIATVFAQCNGLFVNYEEFRHLWELESSVVFNEFLESIVSSDLPFDQELRMFEAALHKIGISENRVRELSNFAQFSWLRVDCKPMKQALYTLISKWSFCYTEYLSNKLHIELQELMAFVRTTSSSLTRVIDGDHSVSLDQIVSHISNVLENKDSSIATLKRMSMIQSLLNTFGFDCPSWIPRALNALPDELVSLNELARRCRSQLQDVPAVLFSS
jgi:dynein heavy chain